MNRTIVFCMALMLTAVSLSGCTGDDTGLNAANERIAELEFQVENDQERIAGLESEAEADEARYQKLMDDFSDDLEEEWYSGFLQGYAEGAPVSTLDLVIDRGYMNCGVKDEQYGMGYAGGSGYSGLDIEYCAAIAAAIGLNYEDINFVLATGADRFNLLSNGDIDVLIRTTTWTTSRDAGLNTDFAGINFYDGQGIMIRSDFVTADEAESSIYGLDGANICVGLGTTSEMNIVDWSYASGVSINPVYVATTTEAMAEFIGGTCDAYTGDSSALVAHKWQIDNDGSMGADDDGNDIEIWIGQELLSKEPLAAVTRDYDSEWNEVVSWVWYAMVTAEEMGISSTNYGSADTSDPSVDRLLYSNMGLGTDANPLPSTWVQNVLDSVGNYGEAYDRSFCDGSYDGVSGSDTMTGCLISRSGTYNALVSEGGLQYAPPMR